MNAGSLITNIQQRIRTIANLGVRYDDMVVKNSQAVGSVEGQYLKQGLLGDEAFMYGLAIADTTVKKAIAYFDKDFKAQREFLRKFSMNGEIQWILDTITDEAIIQDERQYFCYPLKMNADIHDDVEKAYNDNFQKLYTYWRFNDDTTAWSLFYQLLVDGFLAFEIIYDDKAKNIIGFKELDAVTLRPDIERQEDGTMKPIWWQNETDASLRRKLYDSQIIYISYAKGNNMTRTSYVERLVRSFNLLRIMEHTRVIWNVMNASFRLKMIVPIGTKSPQKAKETLGELMSLYKEDVRLDYDSGELFINGRPNIQFYKNYMFPSKNGEQTDIQVIGGEGPDLSNMDPLNYFYNRLKIDSKIPLARFDSTNPSVFNLGTDGIDREEIRFSKFINRLRSIFQEIITKPLYIQMMLDFPSLKDDEIFKSQIGIRFNKDNVFERQKEMDLLAKSLEFINSMAELKITDKDGNEKQFFHPQWLIERYMFLSPQDLEANKAKWDEDVAGAGSDTGEPGAGGVAQPGGEAEAPPEGEGDGGGGGAEGGTSETGGEFKL